MDSPEIVAAMAAAAEIGGAAGLRIEGVANLRAVRARTTLPIVGLVKANLPETAVRITITPDDVAALADAGADIIAYDATCRARPVPCGTLLDAIRQAGVASMADCATLSDAAHACDAGADILGTTLAGYTAATATGASGPDLALVTDLAKLGPFVMAEGRYHAPDQAARAIAAGADAVTVGSAITRIEHITGWFATAIAGDAA